MTEVAVYIGLGSNLDDPLMQVKNALDELAGLDDCRLEAASSLYRGPPMGPADQPDYINAVARLTTRLPAETLLDRLQALEQAHRRVRERHWGPRTLDLDILLYGDSVIDSPRLRVPHPGIAARNFVLYPLAEIDSALVIPGAGPLSGLLRACARADLVKVENQQTVV